MEDKQNKKPFIEQTKLMVGRFASFCISYKRGILNTVLAIVMGIVSTYIYEDFIKDSDMVKVKFKDIDANISREHSGIPKSAVEEFHNGNYDNAIIQMEGFLNSNMGGNGNPDQKRRLAYVVLGASYLKKDSLDIAEKHLLSAYKMRESYSICRLLSRLYMLKFKDSEKDEHFDKYLKFDNEATKIGKYRSWFSAVLEPNGPDLLSNSILQQEFISLKNGAPYREGNVYFIAVGINDYYDAGIDDLDYAINDVDLVSTTGRTVFGNNVHISRLTAGQATKRSIFESIHSLKGKITEMDRLIFYYSGHGFNTNRLGLDGYDDLDGDRYILPIDTDLGNLTSTAISMGELVEAVKMLRLKTNPIFLIDACNNEMLNSDIKIYGNQNSGDIDMKTQLYTDNSSESSPIIVYGSSFGEKGSESSEFENGVFTHYFTEALSENNSITVDIDDDGSLSLYEVLRYVQSKVSHYANEQGYRQNISVD